MLPIVLLLLVAVVAAVFLVLRLQARGGGAGAGGSVGLPYAKAPALFTPAERRFLAVLEEAVWPDYRVFGKVRIADVAQVRPGLPVGARRGALNRVSGKHFDFVVCRSSDLAVVCVVELNDRSHGGKAAQRRDAFVVALCQAIGLPMLQVIATTGYFAEDVRAQFFAAIAPADAPHAPHAPHAPGAPAGTAAGATRGDESPEGVSRAA